jgi:hypothetical protein
MGGVLVVGGVALPGDGGSLTSVVLGLVGTRGGNLFELGWVRAREQGLDLGVQNEAEQGGAGPGAAA